MGSPQLNIKDAEATRLVDELVALTGESKTEVVRQALRQHLQREQAKRAASHGRSAEEQRREFERVWPEIRKIQDEVRRRGLADSMLTDDDLYDENGLPK